MISRVAESCFWLYRYIERMDNTARMIDVNHAFILDTHLDSSEAWMPLLVMAGEAPRFRELHGDGAVDGETAQRYLTWEKENPASISSSTYWARECARTIRESISREMWECLNRVWLWMDQGSGRRSYDRDRSGFFERIKETAQLFRGVSADTMLHEEAYDFMLLGMHVERAGMTARILDVKHEMLSVHGVEEVEAGDFARWQSILRSCSAIEPFLKRGAPLRGISIVEFLVNDPAFPRSIRHCLEEASTILTRIRSVPSEDQELPGRSCAEGLQGLLDYVVRAAHGQGESERLHEAMTHVVETLARVADDLHGDFFEPSIPTPAAPGTVSVQSQS